LEKEKLEKDELEEDERKSVHSDEEAGASIRLKMCGRWVADAVLKTVGSWL